VISHWLIPCGAAAGLGVRGCPHLAVAHSSDVHLLRRLPWASRLLDLVAGPRTRLILTSESLRAPLAALARRPGARDLVESAIVTRMGISPPALVRVDGEGCALREAAGLGRAVVVLFVGRLVPVKGVEQLLGACSGLPGTGVVVIGDGPERARLEATARRLGVPARFLGEQHGEAKARWLRAADLLAAPSVVLADGRTDSAPVVLLEAMAAGLPVVATRVGGNAELIADGSTGLLVQPGSATALRRAIARLAADPCLRAALGRRGAAMAARHGWDRVAPRLRGLLAAL
jgi:glycosyltransferase involved in cell wall biosynthesis